MSNFQDAAPEWVSRRLRFDVTLNPKKSTIDLSDDVEVSFVPMDAVGAMGGLHTSLTKTVGEVRDGYTYFADGDICVAKITPCFENGKGALASGLVNGAAFGTTELHVLRTHSWLDSRFLFYVTITDDFRKFGESEMLGAGGQKRIPERFIKDWKPPLPSPETQHCIARFLDEKTACIDALIEKKRALLERLAEKRQALITQAVTKGLEPDVPMKNSGIEWLGDVPKRWKVRGLTKCTSRVDYRGATPKKADTGVFLVTAKNIKNGLIDYETSKEFVPEENFEYVMRRGKAILGDVLFTTEAPLGEVATVDRENIALAQRIIKFTSSVSGLRNDYLAYWMRSSAFQRDLQSRATGSTAMGIKASKIVDLKCLIPSPPEQRKITRFLDMQTKKLDSVANKIDQSIEKLVEYRSALITAAVTGQLEMPESEPAASSAKMAGTTLDAEVSP